MNLLELANRAGIDPKWVAGTNGGEYHSSCPICGGKDRFYIQPYRQMSRCFGSYCCRQCGIYGDAIQFARQFLNYTFMEAAQIVSATITEKVPFSFIKTVNQSTLKRPSNKWCVEATNFVNQAHERLLNKLFFAFFFAKATKNRKTSKNRQLEENIINR